MGGLGGNTGKIMVGIFLKFKNRYKNGRILLCVLYVITYFRGLKIFSLYSSFFRAYLIKSLNIVVNSIYW